MAKANDVLVKGVTSVFVQFVAFTAKRQSYDYLEEVRQRLAGYLVAVEFRHESWMTGERRDATLAFEQQHAFVNVVVDEPQGARNSIPSVWAITNPALAIVRLHGRNDATWNLKDSTSASDRFNYDYSDEELTALAAPIQQLARSAAQVHAIFNNNFEDQGQRNGQTLMKLIGGVRRQTRL